MIDTNKITDVVLDGIDHNDAPDYCDVYIVSAKIDGQDATEDQLETLNEDRDFVHEMLMEYLY